MFDFQMPAMTDLFFVLPDFPFTNLPKQPSQIKETVIVDGTIGRFVSAEASTEGDNQ